MVEKVLVLTKSNEESSKEALRTLALNKLKFEARDIFINSLTKDEFQKMIEATDLDPKECVRTVDKMYKKIFGEQGLEGVSGDALFENLVKYPRLINRPIVIAGDRACIGRPPSKLEEFIKSLS